MRGRCISRHLCLIRCVAWLLPAFALASNGQAVMTVGVLDGADSRSSVAVSGDRVFVLDEQGDRLRIYDITNPAASHVVGELGLDLGGLTRMEVVGDIVFVAGSDVLYAVDVSDSTQPSLIPSSLALSSPPRSLQQIGSWVYLQSPYDISVVGIESGVPVLKAVVAASDQFLSNLAVIGHTAFVFDGDDRIKKLDVTSPQAPVVAGDIDLPDLPPAGKQIRAHAGWLYVSSNSGVRSVNPDTAGGFSFQIGSGSLGPITNAGAALRSAGGLGQVRVLNFGDGRISEGAVFSATGSVENAKVVGEISIFGSQLIDLSNPHYPTMHDNPPDSGASLVSIGTELGCIGFGNPTIPGLDGMSTVRVVDASEPFNLVVRGQTNQPWVISDLEIGLSEDYCYVADSAFGLRVVDVRDPANPTAVGGLQLPVVSVEIAGSVAFLGGGGGMVAVDLSQPALPAEIKRFDFDARAMEVRDDKLYVSAYDGTFRVIDLTDALDPQEIASEPLFSGAAFALALGGDRAYVVLGNELGIVDITDPTEPSLISTDESRNWGGFPVAQGNLLIISPWNGIRAGPLQVLDLSDPSLPKERLRLSWGRQVQAVGDLLFLGHPDGILTIELGPEYSATPPRPVVFVPGIMGSELCREDHTRVWPPPYDFWDFWDSSLVDLGLTSGVDISPDHCTSQYGIVSALWNDVYGDWLDTLRREFLNYRVVPYDWRRSPADEASRVVAAVSALAAETGEDVLVVTHSMGNFLVKEALRWNPDLADRIAGVVFVAAPQLGAPTLLKALLHGDHIAWLTAIPEEGGGKALLRSLLHDMPGAYVNGPSESYFSALLSQGAAAPITFNGGECEDSIRPDFREYCEHYAGRIGDASQFREFLLDEGIVPRPDLLSPEAPPSQWDLPEELRQPPVMDSGSLAEAERVHSEVDFASGWLPDGLPLFQIVGTGRGTWCGLDYSEEINPFYFESYRLGVSSIPCPARLDGDGTVPRMSADATVATTYYVDLSDRSCAAHGGIMGVSSVQSQLLALARGTTTFVPGGACPISEVAVVREDRLYRIELASPLALGIRDGAGNLTGYDAAAFEVAIPRSIYEETGEKKTVVVPEGPGYTLHMEGTGAGQATLRVGLLGALGAVEEEVEFHFPVVPAMVVALELPGPSGLTVLPLDVDGDGATDITISAGDELDPRDVVALVSQLVGAKVLEADAKAQLESMVQEAELALAVGDGAAAAAAMLRLQELALSLPPSSLPSEIRDALQQLGQLLINGLAAPGPGGVAISGKRINFSDRGAERRSVSLMSRDPAIETPAAGTLGDPTLHGAELKLSNPTTGELDAWELPASGWVGLGNPIGSKGYRYRRSGVGPCSLVYVKPGRLLTARCSGDGISFSLDEPSQGKLAASIRLGTSDSMCMEFGGRVVRDEIGRFYARDADAPPSCASQ